MALRLKKSTTSSVSRAVPVKKVRQGRTEDIKLFADRIVDFPMLWSAAEVDLDKAKQDFHLLAEQIYGDSPPMRVRYILRNADQSKTIDQLISYVWNLKLACEGMGTSRR